MRHLLAWIAAVLMLCRFGAAQAVMPVPSATGYLTDTVGIVEPVEFARIQVLLGRYEATSGRRVSVLLVESTPDESLEDFADRVIDEWNLDQVRNGGALLLWSGEGYVLIRPAPALAGALDEEAQSLILSRWVVPAFGRGEPATGLRQGVEQMIAVLDGGQVAEAPPEAVDTQPEPEPEPAPQDTLELEVAEAEPGSQAAGSTEASIEFDGLPVWIERLPEDLGRLAAPFAQDVDAGVMGWLREAGREAEQMPVQASALLLQMRGERVEPPFPGLSVFAVYAWVLSMGVVLLILLSRRAFVPALFMGALDTGFFLWLATGFVALSSLLVLLGLLAPLLVPMLRAVLRGSDESERDDLATVARPNPQTLMRQASTMSARVPQTRRTPAPPRSPRGLRPPASAHDGGRQRVDLLLDRLGRIAVAEGRRLRLWHAGVLLVLFLISPPLAILVVLGVVVVTAYRSGAAYILVDTIVTERQAREQLKKQLPRPSSDVMPGA